jgi:glutamate-1-semialdehyde 2,1-aminomutase
MHDFLFYNWHNRLGKPLPSGDIEKVWDTQGLVKELDDLLVVVPFNEPGILKQTIERQADQIAAVILEPIMYNAGCIEPIPGFLQDLRDLTQKHGILLIFDEVLSGFRMHRGGAQGYYEITPDLCTLAKAVGCGMTVAALAGRDEVMSHLNPVGRVVMSGTYTGSLMTVMGALAALKVLDEKGFYEQLNERAGYFYSHVSDLLRAKGLKAVVHGVGARFGLYFGLEQAPKSIREVASKYNRKAMHRFSELSVVKRLYFHDFGDGIAPMHAGFTAVHTKEIFDESLNRLEDIFGQMAKERL